MTPRDFSKTPQYGTLHRVLGALAADPAVTGVYIGGSFARGNNDEVSDLDLWVEGEDWKPESIGSLMLVGHTLQIGGVPMLHGVSFDGTILDVMYGRPVWDHFLPLELPAPVPLPPQPLVAGGLIEEFWTLTLKHNKNILRGRFGILSLGLHFDRRILLRAWVLETTGADPGDGAFTIFGLKDIFDRYVTPDRQALLGLPTRNLEESLVAVEQYRNEMTRLFPESTPLERAVRSQMLVQTTAT